MMDDDGFRAKNFDGVGKIVVAGRGQERQVRLQSLEVLFDKISRALVQNSVLAEGEIVEIAATFDEMISQYRSGPGLENFLRL